jgi:hypothetical protein
VRSRLRSDTSFVKVWLITLANASCSLCLFFLSKRYVCTWMHDLPSLSLIYIIWLQVSVILAYIAMVGSISSLWYNIFLLLSAWHIIVRFLWHFHSISHVLMTSFGKLRKTPLFFPLEKKLKAADGGKKN